MKNKKNVKYRKFRNRGPIWIQSVRVQNYLGERGIWPIKEDSFTDEAAYKRTKEVWAAIEDYRIQQTFYSSRKR